MRRNIGAFHLVAEVAKIALIHNLGVIAFCYPIDFKGCGLIYQIKQGRKSITQGNTTTATVADIEDPFQLCKQWCFVIKLRILPVQRVSCRCLEATFAG